MRILVPLLGLACSPEPEVNTDPSVSIELRWIQGHGEDSWTRAEAGLWWSLSQLGARPDDDGSAIIVGHEGSTHVDFRLDLHRIGLSESGLETAREVVTELEESDPYAHWGRADLGRFLMRLLYEPWRYYRATGACGQLEDWKRDRLTDSDPIFAITESMLVEGHRRLRFSPDPGEMAGIAWLAEEGHGSLEDDSFEIEHFEVVDVMANGQPRYALYDASGTLIPAPADASSPIGQPGRCMWCHEQHLMSTVEQPELEGSISWTEFAAQIDTQQALIDAYRADDSTATDFSEHAVHAWSEQLVETFLSPSPERVSREWHLELIEVEDLVASLPLSTHISDEYPEYGTLLTRSEVDAAAAGALGLSKYEPLRTLPSSRDLDLSRSIPQGGLEGLSGCSP